MSTAQTGGGAATHSGTEYQNRVAAWVAVRILAEHSAKPPWDVASTATLDFLRCETLEPVDDSLVGISNSGHAFIQAKHSISLGTKADSEFAGVIDQFVRQFHAHPTAIQHPSPSWNRPLDKQNDRLVLVTSSRSSANVRQVLPAVLNRIRSLTPGQSLDSSAGSADEKEVLATLKEHITRFWKVLKSTDPNVDDICNVASLIRVQTLDVDPGDAQEREAIDMLRQTIVSKALDADMAWSKIVATCASFAASRTGATRRELQQVLVDGGIDIQTVSSYRADIEKLKALSATSIRALSALSEIKLSPSKTVKLTRESTAELKQAATSGSLVVVGQPGAGKSGALHDLASLLGPVGDVLVFAVDQFDAGSLGSLRNELGFGPASARHGHMPTATVSTSRSKPCRWPDASRSASLPKNPNSRSPGGQQCPPKLRTILPMPFLFILRRILTITMAWPKTVTQKLPPIQAAHSVLMLQSLQIRSKELHDHRTTN